MNAYPLSAEQLVILFALIGLLLWILSFLEDRAEVRELREDIEAQRRAGRRLRVLSSRRTWK